MNEYRKREFDRDQWRNLVRGLCGLQSSGYPGGVSVSKHFPMSPPDEIDRMADIAVYLAHEYDLEPDVEVYGDAICVHLERRPDLATREVESAPAVENDKVTVETAQASRPTGLMRLLQFVHPQTRPAL